MRIGLHVVGAVALAAAVGLSGCAVLSWTAAQFAPPERVKALYKPPKGKTILVFVDDMQSQVRYQPAKAELTDRLNAKLTKYNIAAATVPYQKVMELAAATREFSNLAVSEVGRKLNANLVLYVHVDLLSLRDDEQSPLWRGRLHVTIRLVDVGAGRLWPLDDPEGYAVPAVELPPVDNSSPTYRAEVAKQLAEEMAERIANVFRDHDAPPAGGPPEEPSPS